jgi:hypothetical protein
MYEQARLRLGQQNQLRRFLQGRINLGDDRRSERSARTDPSHAISKMFKEWQFISCKGLSWQRRISNTIRLRILHENLSPKKSIQNESDTSLMRTTKLKDWPGQSSDCKSWKNANQMALLYS